MSPQLSKNIHLSKKQYQEVFIESIHKINVQPAIDNKL